MHRKGKCQEQNLCLAMAAAAAAAAVNFQHRQQQQQQRCCQGVHSSRRQQQASRIRHLGVQRSHRLFCPFLDVKLRLRANSNQLRVQKRLVAKPLAIVDPELHKVLELASETELCELSDILYGKSFFSPVLKSVTLGDGSRFSSDSRHVEEVEEQREELLDRLESRLLFLAADAKSTVRGQRPKYRDVLLQVRKKLKVPCSVKLPTEDIEAEIFLFLLREYSSQLKPPEQPWGNDEHESEVKEFKKGSWRGQLLATIRLGSRELMSTVLKGGSALTMSALQRLMVKELSGKMLAETARYQLAKEALKKGGHVVAAKLESHVTMLTARQVLAGAATRYMAIRSTMMLLGPLLWGTFLADVVLTALGTDYARVVRAIYALAQIRLTRTYGWTNVNHPSSAR